MLHTLTFRQIPGSPGQNLWFRLWNYVRNLVIFHLTPVLSKNLEKYGRSSDLKKKYFAKNEFRAHAGIPRIWQKVEKFVFNIFEDKCHTNTLRPKWDTLVVKWRCGRINKLENAKTEIRLVPPPLKCMGSFQIRFLFGSSNICSLSRDFILSIQCRIR